MLCSWLLPAGARELRKQRNIVDAAKLSEGAKASKERRGKEHRHGDGLPRPLYFFNAVLHVLDA